MANHRQPVPTWLDKNYMEDVLRKSLNSPSLIVQAMDVKPGSKAGDNYVCQILRISLLVNDSNQEREISIIGKIMGYTKVIENIDNDLNLFDIESSFFQNLLPGMKNHFKCESIVPECFASDKERNVIFMEDLVSRNYMMPGKGQYLNIKQCILVIEALATFHGASYYEVKKNPGLKEVFRKGFCGSEKNEMLEKLCTNGQHGLEHFLSFYGLSESHSTRLLGFLKKLQENQWFKVCDFQEDRLNFLLHGDCWSNNVMFHYTENDPDDVKLIDFQIVNYNSFANDLQLFLFSSAEASVLLNEIDFLIERYYAKLSWVAPDIPGLTLERIKAEFAERYYFGYLIAVLFRAYTVAETPVDMEDIMNGKDDFSCYGVDRYCKDLNALLPFLEEKGAF